MTDSGLIDWLEGLLDAVWLVDARTLRLQAANQAAGRLSGLTPEAMVGLPVIELAASPEDMFFWEDVAAGLQQSIHSNTLLRSTDGEAVPVERKVSRVRLPGQSPVYLVALRDLRSEKAVEEALEGRLAEIRATLESSTDGILVTDLAGRVRHFNRSFTALWALTVETLEPSRLDDIPAILEQAVCEPDSYRAGIDAALQQEGAALHDVVCLHSGKVLERTIVPQVSRQRTTGLVHSFRDVTAQRAVLEAQRLAAKVFESSPDAVFITDAEFRLVRANPRCDGMLAARAEPLTGSTTDTLFFDPDRPALFAEVEMALLAHGAWSGEVWCDTGKGVLPVAVSWVALLEADGRICNTVAHFSDMTERLEAQRHIERLAYRDALTGLPNRTLLGQRVEFALRLAERCGGRFAIMFLDLDRFKTINDSLGHAFGDRVLMEVAERVQHAMRDVDTLSRMGGDEFVAFLQDADGAGAETAARRILAALAQPFTLDGMPFSLGCSIGIALYPADGQTLDELIKCADTAMYRVKDRGRGDFRFYQPQMNVDLLSRMKMDHAMRRAMEQGLFRLHYQPQISLSDGRLLGAEALLRWTDPELGVVSPGEFIPLAEETGFIIAIGHWVMQEAVQQAAFWQRTGLPVCVSVNVSALQFQQSDFVNRVAQCIADAGLDASLLELELTESILVRDANEALNRLHALHALGVSLAIDDFGTGYSSLAYLKKFPISKLKIDRTFVTGLPGDDSDRAIVSATIAMAKALKLAVVAEGVETVAQRDFLAAAHCRAYQGFLCAPGLPPEEFLAMALKLGLGNVQAEV
ncbi:MAG: EAL domain-containing protein [Curvibacter sp.]|nr:MAG: EAL domain-containing protein [Curvibacter sp.]